MKKTVLLIMICIFVLLCLSACGKGEYDIVGKTYVNEKDGFGSAFGIRLDKDGKVNYYEGMLSSHLGFATWSREGNIVTIAENVQGIYKEYKFEIKKDRIEYIKEGSSDFLYVRLEDGAQFFESKEGK